MKKVFCVSLIALMLVCLLCASALAQTTGIAMDGKVYTFTGGEGTCLLYTSDAADEL